MTKREQAQQETRKALVYELLIETVFIAEHGVIPDLEMMLTTAKFAHTRIHADDSGD